MTVMEDAYVDAMPETYLYKRTELPKGSHCCIESRTFRVPPSASSRHRLIPALNNHLAPIVGQDIADRTVMALDEALLNAETHAHHKDFSKVATATYTIFDHYILLSVQTQGEPWDVRKVRTSCVNPDGSIHMGTSGRGHVAMIGFTDQCGYSDYGREWYGVIKRD